MHLDNKVLISSFLFISLYAIIILYSNYAIAAEYFTIVAKIDLTNITNPEKLKIIASANGESSVKYVENLKDTKLKSLSIPFTFEETNKFVTVGSNDEYFVCAYNIENETGVMKSYSCHEGDIKLKNGKSSAELDLFQTVQEVDGNSDINDIKINVLVPLSDRKNVENIKVIAMDKGELKHKSINAAGLLNNSTGDTIKFTFNFDRESEIGPIRKGDMYFACVSANALNPPEGTECEHRLTKTIGVENNLYAR
jgi:hypothetical protein